MAKEGVASLPVSILRKVSGDIAAADATSTIERLPRACRMKAPKRRPRSMVSGVCGMRTIMLPMYRYSLTGIFIPLEWST